MAEMPSKLELDSCPHCSVNRPNLHLQMLCETKAYAGRNVRSWAGYACLNCGGIVTISVRHGTNSIDQMFPEPMQPDAEIPATARDYLGQAMRSLHAPSGAVMLAASSVDAMLKAKGYKQGTLYARIDKAAEEHKITADMAQWAHQVRLDANDQRHADEAAPLPNEEDALRCVDFASALGKFMFTLPARVAKGIKESGKRK